MAVTNLDSYNYNVGLRLKRIMEICDLTISGFNAFSGISDSHLYALVNGNRKLTPEIAQQLGNSLNFDGNILFNLNITLPDSIAKSKELNNFKKENEVNFKYFKSGIKKQKRSDIAFDIIKNNVILAQPKYLSEIRTEVNLLVKQKFTSNELTKILNYLIITGKLSKIKQCKKLKSGQLSRRLYDFFQLT